MSSSWWNDRTGKQGGKSKWWEALGSPCSNVVLVRLTPDLAQELWKRNVKNRRFRQALASFYSIEMKAGRWVCNGETIVFDSQGRLIQGQHRIYAVMMSGVTIMVYMVFDVDPAAFMTMDSGSKRSAADQLEVVGHKNATMLAGAATIIHRYNEGNMTSSNHLPNTLCIDVIEKCPGLDESVKFVSSHRPKFCKGSVASAVHYLAKKIDPELADEFFTKLFSGVGLCDGDPELTLSKKLSAMNIGASRRVTKSFVEFHCFAIAWNAKRDGRELSMIRIPSVFDSNTIAKLT